MKSYETSMGQSKHLLVFKNLCDMMRAACKKAALKIKMQLDVEMSPTCHSKSPLSMYYHHQ